MNKSSLLRHLPSVDKVHTTIRDRDYSLPEAFVVSQIRETIDSYRQQILTDRPPEVDSAEAMEELVVNEVDRRCRDRIRRTAQPLINATGIVLHTGLGRAPLSDRAREAMTRAAYGYTNLEFDLPSGTRGERNDHIEDFLRALTGAESALMVNNNAAAVFLALNTLAAGSEAIISRGQLIEIGGSFRIPEVMAKSGARMVEVGTTNRTHLRDYRKAITDQTRLILIAHPSNYRVQGFTASPKLPEIVELGHTHEIPVLYDLGSGALFPLEEYGLPDELIVEQVVETGVDVITFSGDKLIGGPQAGLICGKKHYLDAMKANPLTRVLRCDKTTFAAMEATLGTYINPDALPTRNTTYQLITRSMEELHQIGEAILGQLSSDEIDLPGLELREAATEAGSGSLPTERIPSMALVLTRTDRWSADRIMRWLRTRETMPIVGYIVEDECYLNLRTILPDQEEAVVRALRELAEAIGGE